MTDRIDSLESFDINSSTQWVLLRGNPFTRRVLLIVQQGPGIPLINEARALEQRLHLEADAVVAYWDQRGTGRSCDVDPSTISVAQGVADVRAIVDVLCKRLHVDRVDILGFSLGATLATMAAAENPARIGRLVAVGIDVDFAEAERYAYAFACDQAKRHRNRRAQRQLRAIGAPPHDTGRKFATRARWLTAFGGVRRDMGYAGLLWMIVRSLVGSPHYSIRQALRAVRAIERTQGFMIPHLRDFDLRMIVSRIAVPIVFFQGRHDFATTPAIVASFADALGKPLVWFENSAHMPYYEEPARFREALLEALEVAVAAA